MHMLFLYYTDVISFVDNGDIYYKKCVKKTKFNAIIDNVN